MFFTVKPLSFDPAKLQGLSENLIVGHYVSVYCQIVKRLNAITAQLGNTDFATASPALIAGLKQEEFAAVNSMILHETYFHSLGGSSLPPRHLMEGMERDFGGFEKWHAEFTALARAHAATPGWVVTAWSSRDQRMMTHWGSDCACMVAGGLPILAMDLHEHAYQPEFGFRPAGYVEAFMKNINWERVAQRYLEVSSRSEPVEPDRTGEVADTQVLAPEMKS